MTQPKPSRKETAALRAFCEETARGAGRILADGFNRKHRVVYKGRIDPVTERDLLSEKFIVGRIRKTYPDHAVLTEEGSNVEEKSPFLWVIDPLDGTVNYAHGFPVYTVSVAVKYCGDSVAGAVYDPEKEEMFSAGLGLGATLNGRRLKVSAEKQLGRAMLVTGFAYNVGTARRNNLGLFARMVKTAQAVRRLGSAAMDLCWLAAGRIDGFWELYLHPWDTAAATLIVTEAGGTVTRINGKPHSDFDPDLLATNGHLHAAFKRALNRKR